MPPLKPIKGGDVIDLGGKTLEVYDLPGHTPGGILLLLKEDRILFTGDSVNHHLWMQLDGCPDMKDYVKALDDVMFLEKEADLILHGHATGFDDISLLRCMRQGRSRSVMAKRKKISHMIGLEAWQNSIRLCLKKARSTTSLKASYVTNKGKWQEAK